ncbi:hypothetical protein WDV06_28410 [Streptomyces racemochromogenes]|uniref:Secreted protein n=1 Tax=Streptomyces racemochromogenes TaxID=67353 RepID=A0ABW7PKQ4_9ACTN
MSAQPFWTRRPFVFAASAVIAAGSAVLNVAAFAAVHGTPHIAVADQQVQCIKAPCAPADGGGPWNGKDGHPRGNPSHHVRECFAAPCGPADGGFPPPNPAPTGTRADVPDDSGTQFKGGPLA